ncbi:pyrimidine-specific ribonucleoside hydrolase RihB [Gottschalkia purinilytica]|uniref:Pyrimidine-specific ribonucleoside hydrolase RihB n=1 Tax=Gottschalkia purinilytica TaxID=1503 RepID=A0A0L0W8T9_GOTPU|nr:nucleoside hydrolase [Gottschalkia purinilytica]KNF07866.1 pyrimidine-specific ribonucleoside hydrolase RihB [Gottschalkia purinilytica]
MSMKKVIIDVDTGIDDAMAIMLAIKSKKLDVMGITTVAGNTSIDYSTKNTLRVLKTIGREDIQVYRGCSQPLIRDTCFCEEVHGNNGLAGALEDLEVEYKHKQHGVDYIIDEVMRNKGEITLVLLAPMTNVAMALRKEPEIAKYIKEIVTMGGVTTALGNESLVSEFNIYADPESAKIVFNSGVPIKMVGLDVTRKTLLMEEQLKSIEGDEKVTSLVKEIGKYYIDMYSGNNEIKCCALHDPLAVGVAIDESLVKTKKLFVDVETKSEHCDGQTICDFFGRSGREPNVEVCLEVDSNRFVSMFLDVIQS